MANINSLMSSSSTSTSSLYGTRNVLSGLASGMDTESMIENSVSGYKTKITQLEQQQTKYQWKQDAYRSITDKMYELTQSYTSYTSKTNLYSNAFFNTSVTTNVTGAAANIDKLSATGKTSSDIQILAAQTATSARYSVDASALALKTPGTNASSAVETTGGVTVGVLKGSMTLSYGSQTIDISFDEIEDKDITTAAKLQSAIQDKLSKINISTSAGVKKASDVINVSVDAKSDGSIGPISFSEKSGYGGNTPFISSIDTSLKQRLSFSSITVGNRSGYAISGVVANDNALTPYQESQSKADYLNGKEISVTLDGVNKTFKLDGLTSSTDAAGNPVMNASTLVKSLQSGIDKAFGENKVTVSLNDGKLSFDLKNTSSTFAVTAKDANVGKTLGIGEEGLTNYLNTGASIKSLLGDSFSFFDGKGIQADDSVTMTAEPAQYYKGSDGKRYTKDAGGVYHEYVETVATTATPEGVTMSGTADENGLYRGTDNKNYVLKDGQYYLLNNAASNVNAGDLNDEGNGLYTDNDNNSYKQINGQYYSVSNVATPNGGVTMTAGSDGIYTDSDGNSYKKVDGSYYQVTYGPSADPAPSSVTMTPEATGFYTGDNGKRYVKDGDDYYQVDNDGKRLYASVNNAAQADSDVTMTASTDKDTAGLYKGSDGHFYKKLADNDYRMVNEKGDFLYELKINDKSIYVSENSSLDSVINSINASDAGVTASYSRLTGKFVFTANDTGVTSQVSFDNDLAKSLFTTGDPTQRTLGDIFGDSIGSGNIKLSIQGNSTKLPTDGATFNANTTVADVLKSINDKTVSGNAIFAYVKYDEATGQFLTTRNTTYDPATGEFTDNADTVWATLPSWKLVAYDENNQEIRGVKAADFFRGAASVGEERSVGTDATVVAKVNGQDVTLKRASNTIDMDGLSVNLKEGFGDVNNASSADAVSFKTTANSDSLVSTITEFIDKYNAILKEVHDAYATAPAEKSSSSHSKYEPLTDDDKAGMSETAIKNYEEKAKQGLLFGDSDLSSLYSRMVNAFSLGSNASELKDMGITTSYSGGVTQIKIEESKLRAALESNPDKVRDAFTKSKEGGAASDGLMTSIKKTMEQYGSTSVATPGILVRKAGSNFSSVSLLNNSVQKQIDTVQTQIERWQKKMSSKIDYYTRQFTALEKLMNTMNSQSSALAGLMGGY